MRTSHNVEAITLTYNHAADLVQAWGTRLLPCGSTIVELLTFDGVSLWDVISPSLTINKIAPALLVDQRPAGRGDVKAYGSWGKRLVLDQILSIAKRTDSGWPQGEDCFLFLGFTPYIYRDILEPVASRLAGNRTQVVVLDDQFGRKTPGLSGAPWLQSIWHHWSLSVADEERALRRRLRDVLKVLTGPRGFVAALSADEHALWPQFRVVFDWLVWAFLPRMMSQYAIARHVVRDHRPAIIISPDVHDPRTRMYCLLARAFGIPALEIQFGLHGPETVEWRFFVADLLAASGENTREVVRLHAIPAERIRLTGSPRFDQSVAWPTDDAERVLRCFAIPPGHAVVVFASAYYFYGAFDSPAKRRGVLEALFDAVERTPGIWLLVKPHPIEESRELHALIGGRARISLADKTVDIRHLIRCCDAFVTLGSTSTIDALLMGKLVITLALPGCAGTRIFADSGATLATTSVGQIPDALACALPDRREAVLAKLGERRAEFFRKWVWPADGGAAARIEALAREMIEARRNGSPTTRPVHGMITVTGKKT